MGDESTEGKMVMSEDGSEFLIGMVVDMEWHVWPGGHITGMMYVKNYPEQGTDWTICTMQFGNMADRELFLGIMNAASKFKPEGF